MESIKKVFCKIDENLWKIDLKLEKSKSGGGLGALGGDLETKNLLKAALAHFGQFSPRSDRLKSRQIGPRWRQVGAKMAARSSKLGPRWPS